MLAESRRLYHCRSCFQETLEHRASILMKLTKKGRKETRVGTPRFSTRDTEGLSPTDDSCLVGRWKFVMVLNSSLRYADCSYPAPRTYTVVFTICQYAVT